MGCCCFSEKFHKSLDTGGKFILKIGLKVLETPIITKKMHLLHTQIIK